LNILEYSKQAVIEEYASLPPSKFLLEGLEKLKSKNVNSKIDHYECDRGKHYFCLHEVLRELLGKIMYLR